MLLGDFVLHPPLFLQGSLPPLECDSGFGVEALGPFCCVLDGEICLALLSSGTGAEAGG